MIHIAAVTQLRHRHRPGRTYYRRKRAEGKKSLEAMQVPQAQDLRQHLPPARRRRTTTAAAVTGVVRAREGTAGRLKNPARSTYPRTSTLRISHFPDPQDRRYARPALPGRGPCRPPVDNRREPQGLPAPPCASSSRA